MMTRRCLSLFLTCLLALGCAAQRAVVHPQVSFPDSIPVGGYSGITYIGDDMYAVVSDNAKRKDGFSLFRIRLDSVGAVASASCVGFMGNDDMGHDNEGIAWFPSKKTFFISGEADNQVRELSEKGIPTGRRLALPKEFGGASRAYGLEALTYNGETHRFWTTSESTLKADGPMADPENGVKNRLRLQAFDDDLQPVAQFVYEMDAPSIEYKPETYAFGVSALAAMDDGRLLVLEREAAVPESKIGAQAVCKIYMVKPELTETPKSGIDMAKAVPLDKRLVAEWETAVGLLECSFANFEGMCLGPKLADGGQVVLLIADSQYGYANILLDWLKTVVIY